MNVPTITPATTTASAPASARAADSAPSSTAGNGFAELMSGQGQASGSKPAQERVVASTPRLASAADVLKPVVPEAIAGAPETEAAPSIQAPNAVPDTVPPSDIAAAAPVKPEVPVAQLANPMPADGAPAAVEMPVAIAIVATVPKPTVAKPAERLPIPAKLESKQGGDKGKAVAESDPLLPLAMVHQGDQSVMPVQVAPADPAEPVVVQADAALAPTIITKSGDPAVDPQDMSAEIPDAIAAAGQGVARKATTAAATRHVPESVEQAAATNEKVVASADSLRGTGSAAAADLPVAGRTVAFHEVYAAPKPVAVTSDASSTVAARTGTMGRDMGVEIARSVSAGKEQLVVRMDPADMGRIHIQMSFDREGGLRAVVSADNQGTLDLMKREMGDLSRALSDAGVRADSQSFRFDTRSGDGGHPGQRGQQQAGANGRQDGTNTEDGDAIPGEQLAYRALRASGRVDMMA